jgi:hypothetical protein
MHLSPINALASRAPANHVRVCARPIIYVIDHFDQTKALKMVTTRRQASLAARVPVGPRRSVPRNQVSERARRLHDRRAQQARRVKVLGPVHPARPLPAPAAPDHSQDDRTRSIIQGRMVQDRSQVLAPEFAAALQPSSPIATTRSYCRSRVSTSGRPTKDSESDHHWTSNNSSRYC